MLRGLCEELVLAYEKHGARVRANLRPGLRRSVIQDMVRPTGLELPESIIQIYEWADGHVDNNDHENTVAFRDNTFISLSWAIEQYFQMQSTYGGADATLEVTRVAIDKCFPISLNNGSWDTVVCGPHSHDPELKNPIVRVFQGHELFFDSTETMIKTCIAWVNCNEWRRFFELPPEIEREIWKRENPVWARGPDAR